MKILFFLSLFLPFLLAADAVEWDGKSSEELKAILKKGGEPQVSCISGIYQDSFAGKIRSRNPGCGGLCQKLEPDTRHADETRSRPQRTGNSI